MKKDYAAEMITWAIAVDIEQTGEPGKKNPCIGSKALNEYLKYRSSYTSSMPASTVDDDVHHTTSAYTATEMTKLNGILLGVNQSWLAPGERFSLFTRKI